MRKLFFLLVLASGMLVAQTPNATNTQTIGKFLKLSKVPSGLATDNVLVRGTNGIVKSVPRSEFGGGNQNLQNVLSKGGEITDGDLYIGFNTPNGKLNLAGGYISVGATAYDGITTSEGYLSVGSGGSPGVVYNYAQLDLGYAINGSPSTFSHIVPNKHPVDTWYNLPENTVNAKTINLLGDAPLEGLSYARKEGQWVSFYVPSITNNQTTTSLTLYDLLSLYPNSQVGDKVNCLSIGTGAIQYERTSTGWVSKPLTVIN